MLNLGTAIILAPILVTLGVLIVVLVRQHWLASDGWLIECPESESYVSVRLSQEPTTWISVLNRRAQTHVVGCEQWPDRYGCAQTCIRHAPKETV